MRNAMKGRRFCMLVFCLAFAFLWQSVSVEAFFPNSIRRPLNIAFTRIYQSSSSKKTPIKVKEKPKTTVEDVASGNENSSDSVLVQNKVHDKPHPKAGQPWNPAQAFMDFFKKLSDGFSGQTTNGVSSSISSSSTTTIEKEPPKVLDHQTDKVEEEGEAHAESHLKATTTSNETILSPASFFADEKTVDTNGVSKEEEKFSPAQKSVENKAAVVESGVSSSSSSSKVTDAKKEVVQQSSSTPKSEPAMPDRKTKEVVVAPSESSSSTSSSKVSDTEKEVVQMSSSVPKAEATKPDQKRKEIRSVVEAAIEQPKPKSRDDNNVFSQKDWEASIEAAQKSIDGSIADLDLAVSSSSADDDDDGKAKWDSAQKLAQELGGKPLETYTVEEDEEEEPVDLDSLAEAARLAVEAYERDRQEENEQRTLEKQQWAKATSLSSEKIPQPEVKEEEPPVVKKEEPKQKNWFSLNVARLKEELGKRGLRKSGRKAELVARLEEADGSPTTTVVDAGSSSSSGLDKLTPKTSSISTREQLEIALVADAGATDWSKLRVVDLKAELRRRGLPTTGRKNKLVAALEESDLSLQTSSSSTEPAINGLLNQKEEANSITNDVAEAARAAVEMYETNELPRTADLAPNENYSDMTVATLKDMLRARGLRISGRKAALIARLEKYEAAQPADTFGEEMTGGFESMGADTLFDHDVQSDLPVWPKFDGYNEDLEEIAKAAREAVQMFESSNNNVDIDTDVNFANEPPLSSSSLPPESVQFDGYEEDLEEIAKAAREAVELFEANGINVDQAEVNVRVSDEDDHPLMGQEWSKQPVSQLKAELKARGLPTAGNRMELIAALEAADLEELKDSELLLENKRDATDDDFDDLDLNLEDLDLEALGRAAREAVERFDVDDEPSDEALWEIENAADHGEPILFSSPAPDPMLLMEEEEDAPPVTAPPPDYESMAVSQLKEELKRRGLRVTGKKVVLIERLQASD